MENKKHSDYSNIMPGFPALFTFYCLLFSSRGSGKLSLLRELNDNGVWVNKEYILEKGNSFLPNIKSENLSEFIEWYDTNLNPDNGYITNLLNEHINRFGLPLEAPIKHVHPNLLEYINSQLDDIHPHNCGGEWIVFWRDIKLKQILE